MENHTRALVARVGSDPSVVMYVIVVPLTPACPSTVTMTVGAPGEVMFTAPCVISGCAAVPCIRRCIVVVEAAIGLHAPTVVGGHVGHASSQWPALPLRAAVKRVNVAAGRLGSRTVVLYPEAATKVALPALLTSRNAAAPAEPPPELPRPTLYVNISRILQSSPRPADEAPPSERDATLAAARDSADCAGTAAKHVAASSPIFGGKIAGSSAIVIVDDTSTPWDAVYATIDVVVPPHPVGSAHTGRTNGARYSVKGMLPTAVHTTRPSTSSADTRNGANDAPGTSNMGDASSDGSAARPLRNSGSAGESALPPALSFANDSACA